MPIYGYACNHCGHTLDALQKIADDPLVDCPECEQPALKRQLSAPRFRLKGQGWYETDFKKDNQRNLAGEKEPAKADGKSGGKGNGKDAATGDGKADGSKKADEPKPAVKPEKKAETPSSTSKDSAA